MNKLKSGILLAYAILAMSAPAVLAAQPADADNQTAGAALVNMDSRNDKEASKDCSGSDKTSSETDHDTLIPVDSDMLSDADFSVNGIGLDSTVDSVKAKLHNPDSAISRGIYDEYNWKGISVEALKPFLNKYVNRKDLSIGSQIKHTGISKIVITSDSIKTARGVTAGMNRESVLRKYGRPDKVLWKKFDDSFCLVYKKENNILAFNLNNDTISSIDISGGNSGTYEIRPSEYAVPSSKSPLSANDFDIAGLKLGDALSSDDQENWVKKVSNAVEEMWYYSGYTVKATKQNKLIETLFLTDNQMLTSRGLSKGDDVTTAELLYGKPDKIELDLRNGTPYVIYIYFSKDLKNIFAVYIKEDNVDSVMCAKNPQYTKQSNQSL